MKLMLIWTNGPSNFNRAVFDVHASFSGWIYLGVVAKTLTFPKRCPIPTNSRDRARSQAHKEACCLLGCKYAPVPWILLIEYCAAIFGRSTGSIYLAVHISSADKMGDVVGWVLLLHFLHIFLRWNSNTNSIMKLIGVLRSKMRGIK